MQQRSEESSVSLRLGGWLRRVALVIVALALIATVWVVDPAGWFHSTHYSASSVEALTAKLNRVGGGCPVATADLKAGRVRLKEYPFGGGSLVDNAWVWKPGFLTNRELAMIETPHHVFAEASCDHSGPG